MRHVASGSLTSPGGILLGASSWSSIVSEEHREKVTEMSYFFRNIIKRHISYTPSSWHILHDRPAPCEPARAPPLFN